MLNSIPNFLAYKYFTSKSDWAFYIVSTAKTACKETGALICSMKFFSPNITLCLL